MNEHKHANGIVQQATDWFTKQLFLDAYEAADDAFWRRDNAPYRWLRLGGLIEYSGDFLAIAQDGGTPVYLAMFRAAPHVDLKHVTIKIKVKKAGAIHAQQISIDELTSTPIRKALNGIPLIPKRSRSTQGAKLGDVYIKLVCAIDSDGIDLVQGRKIATIFSPTCTVSALQRYAKRWGQYWNVDEMNVAKQLIKNLWYRRLVQSVGQLWRPLRLRRSAFCLLSNPLALSLNFWSDNLCTARALRAAIATGARQRKDVAPEFDVARARPARHGRPAVVAA